LFQTLPWDQGFMVVQLPAPKESRCTMNQLKARLSKTTESLEDTHLNWFRLAKHVSFSEDGVNHYASSDPASSAPDDVGPTEIEEIQRLLRCTNRLDLKVDATEEYRNSVEGLIEFNTLAVMERLQCDGPSCAKCELPPESAGLEVFVAEGFEGDTVKLKACSGCGVTRYCSRECQIEHWKVGHKKVCKQLKSEKIARGDIGAVLKQVKD